MQIIMAATVRHFTKYGWLQVDNGYVVAWTVDGRNMSVVQDATTLGQAFRYRFPHEPDHVLLPDNAAMVMIDGDRATTMDGVGQRITEYSSPGPAPVGDFNWRSVVLAYMPGAALVCSHMVPHHLPGVFALHPDRACSLYMTEDKRGLYVRQEDRPDWLGMIALMRSGCHCPLPVGWV